jgi:nucleotide-binding universal stress UspA family protein
MYQHILVPVDGSATSNLGLDEAIKLARLSGGRLRLLHILDDLPFVTGLEYCTADLLGLLREGGEEILASAKARVEASGIGVECVLSETYGGRVCEIVADQSRLFGADLIVIGTHGRRGIGRLVIGSDAEQIVRVATVPVLLVRAIAADTATAQASSGVSATLPAAIAVAA